MQKFKSFILWGMTALVCIVFLSVQSQAAEYKMGPGDHYDASGNIVALDGTMLMKADGTIIKDPFKDSQNGVWIDHVQPKQTDEKPIIKSQSLGVVEQKVQPNYSVAETADGKIYSFEGKQYMKADYYGNHKLTGYAAQETGNDGTYSGKRAQAGHTVAAPSDLPIGTVIIVEGTKGPYPSRYTGVYVVEDRGGSKLESEGLIDIFFGSIAESEYVTAAGWNLADVWIAKPVR